MNISLTKISGLLLLMALLAGCQKEVVKQYQINEVNLYTSASEKKNLKTDEQFISILYTDVFGQAISNSDMQTLNRAYTSMGDKSLVIDILIKSMLSNTAAIITTDTEMRAGAETFVADTYKRFLVRKPSAQES